MEGFFSGSRELAELLIEKGEENQKNLDLLACEREAMSRELKEIEGVLHYWDVPSHKWLPKPAVLPEDPPIPDAIEFLTLNGLIDYINENPENAVPTDGTRLILQVFNERTVALLTQPSANHRERHEIARAQAHTPKITLDRYMDTDSFITELLSCYIETDARATLFNVVSGMVKEQSATVTDDGVGQNITVKSGVSTVSNLIFKNPVPLRPRRTFAEVQQPESMFTLRVNQDAEAALFESDGALWRIEAANNIRDYLVERITNPAVLVLA